MKKIFLINTSQNTKHNSANFLSYHLVKDRLNTIPSELTQRNLYANNDMIKTSQSLNKPVQPAANFR